MINILQNGLNTDTKQRPWEQMHVSGVRAALQQSLRKEEIFNKRCWGNLASSCSAMLL